MFMLIVIFLPGGLMEGMSRIGNWWKRRKGGDETSSTSTTSAAE
jgi:hypothetical protein